MVSNRATHHIWFTNDLGWDKGMGHENCVKWPYLTKEVNLNHINKLETLLSFEVNAVNNYMILKRPLQTSRK